MPLKRLLAARSSRLLAARSSSASHFSKDYQHEATDDDLLNVFHSIPLSNDVFGTASSSELLGLGILLCILVFKHRFAISKNSYAIWVAALCVSYYNLAAVTWIPLLSTIIFTRTSYPYLVVIPHCIVSVCAYRAEIEKRSEISKVHVLSRFGLSFFCYGFGGSILSDLLMGLPVTALSNSRILPCYVLGYVLVWYSPGDILYSSYSNPSSFAHYFLVCCEAVDTITTPMGRISRSARELQNKVSAPLMAGLFAGVGGGTIRYFERVIVQGDGHQHGPSMKALEAGVWRTVGYSLLFWWFAVHQCESGELSSTEAQHANHCSLYNGSDDLRAWIVITYTLWALACEVGSIASTHPFAWFGQTVVARTWNLVVKVLSLGPQEKKRKME